MTGLLQGRHVWITRKQHYVQAFCMTCGRRLMLHILCQSKPTGNPPSLADLIFGWQMTQWCRRANVNGMFYAIKIQDSSSVTHSLCEKDCGSILRHSERIHREGGACHWKDCLQRMRSEVFGVDHDMTPTCWLRALAAKLRHTSISD